jgi:UDP-N-acetylglucosamine 1-carboxyvinyltransferase
MVVRMDRFIIEGGCRLDGTFVPAGNKNAALPLIAACLLSDAPIQLENIPQIGDVITKFQLIERLGATVEPCGAGTWRVHARAIHSTEPDARRARAIRSSLLLAGPLLARCGRAVLARPGGDMIGRRRIDTHFQALEALGARIEVTPESFVLHADHLRGADIFLDEMSVTGTEQAILAAVLAEGTSTIANAASEPHVQDLCRFLNVLGARITGIGTNALTVEGVAALGGGRYAIGPDFMEVASLIGLAAVTRSGIRIAGARPREHRMTRLVFGRLGVTWDVDGEDIVVPAEQSLCVQNDALDAIPTIASSPWPGFNPDLLGVALIIATQAQGTVLIHEKMFESRLFFVDRLIAMGARIVLCDPHRAVVVGPSTLYGIPDGIPSPDIRAGMALLSAALCARGRSVIHNIAQIDRGYERIDERLRALGACITRVSD